MKCVCNAYQLENYGCKCGLSTKEEKMTKEELEKLLELLNKFEKAVYPEDTGSSEESDLHSVQYDVKYHIENGVIEDE